MLDVKKYDYDKNNVLVSVIIPIYNAEDYLEKCLDSIVNQTIHNIEIICINDCSTDSSLEILNQYASKDCRIKIINNETNLNAGVSRNKGIEAAKGLYLHFADADDWLENDAYEEMVNCISEAEADICFCSINKFDNETEKIIPTEYFQFPTGTVSTFVEKYDFFLNTNVAPWNKLYRTEFLKNNNILFDDLICANDRTFYFSTITQAKKIVFLKEKLYNYRINNSNSLVGQARRLHYDCHFKAYNNSKYLMTAFDNDVRQMFLKISMSDIFSFFCKIPHTKENIANLRRFISSIEDDFDIIDNPEETQPWYSNYLILKILENKAQNDYIPIVFSTNDNYAAYMSVAIQSLIAHINSDKKYIVFVFHSGLSSRYVDMINSMFKDKIEMHFINVKAKVESETKKLYSRAHYSNEMYYRILIPDLFLPVEKVLYLDCDIIVNSDVSELYSIDIGDNILGGVVNTSSVKMVRYINNILNIHHLEYINSGILLINCEQFRQNKIKEKCFELVSQKKDYACPDQDILNISCNGQIYYLDMEWNYQWYYSIMDPTTDNFQALADNYIEMYNSVKKFKILHFTSGIKAWNAPQRKNAFLFWEYAKNNPFYTEIICRNSENIMCNFTNGKQVSALRKKIEELSDNLDWNRKTRSKLETQNKSLSNDVTNYKRASELYLQEINNIRSSFTYKIGRIITYLPRKIRELLRK